MRGPTEEPESIESAGVAAPEAESSEAQSELSASEQREVQQLKARDAEVRTHEQAHLAAAGSLSTAGPFYDYETGPDGRRYAVGGEVRISAPEGRTPDETIRIQEQLIRAALAPAEPSTQDRRVAAGARAKIQQAKVEKATETSEGEDAAEAGGTDTPSPAEDARGPADSARVSETDSDGVSAEASDLASQTLNSPFSTAYVSRALSVYSSVATA